MAPAQQSDLKQSANHRFHTFASTTVHHMREPVRMVNIYADLLRQSELGSNASLEALGYLTKAAMQMQHLLDGLAEFAAATAGPSHLGAFDLNLPLSRALDQLEDQVKSTHAIITKANLPSASFDFDQVQLVFHHLLRNALQYRSPEVTTEISISAHEADCNSVIEVQDNGQGIEPEYRHRIFDLYSRLHGKSHPGNGLGLPICKAIVESHGGRIWVEPGLNGGSKFVFTLPR